MCTKDFPTAVLLLGGLVLGSVGTSSAAQLRVISANPVEAALHELAREFEEQTGQAVEVVVSGTGTINQLLAGDEPADVVVGTSASIDQGIEAGQASGPKTYVARVGIGIIVREDGPAPDVSTPDALRQAALDADRVVFNTAGSGRYVEQMFAGLGIGEQVTAKSARPGNAPETMARMMDGDGMEIGFGLLSEIGPYEGNGIELVGRLPEELQNYTVYEGIVLERSAEQETGWEFIRFIARPEAREVFASTGVD